MVGHFRNTEVQVDDEKAIRALLDRLYDAWARGDGEAYAACFAEESDYITFNGMHLRGRAENAELHGALFRSVLKGTKLAHSIVPKHARAAAEHPNDTLDAKSCQLTTESLTRRRAHENRPFSIAAVRAPSPTPTSTAP
jgi:uncharacterized protein (TIGR02246 family)